MKKIIILSLLVIFLILPAIALGQDDTGLTPDNPFYFLKSWKEKVQTFFTFGAENKAKQFLHLADVRLAEYQKMVEKGKTEIAEKTLEKYQNQLDRALNKIEEVKIKGKDIKELSEKAEQATSRHLEVLQENLQRVPEQARKGLENAIENSSKNIEKVLGKKITKPDELADWKTYNETDFGFSFQYPGTWTVDDNLTSNACCLNILNYDPLKKQSEWQEKGEVKIQIANYKKSASVNLKDFVSSQTYMGTSDIKATSVEDVNIAGINGIKSNLQGDGIYYLPQSSTGGVSITIFNHPENKDTFKEIINQLLSTFKLIEQKSKIWKTYTNEILGISFEYPEEWGEVIERQNGYDFSFPERTIATLNSGWIFMTRATAEEVNSLQLREVRGSSKTKESVGGVRLYINDYIGKGNMLERIYAFENKKKENILIWFTTNRDAGIGNVEKNQKVFENIDEYKDFEQMLSTFKFIKDETVRKEPYIKIISPKKGDIWKVGETHDIVWDSFGIDKVNIYSGNANGAFSMSALDIAVNIPASLGKYSWTINKYDSWRDATKIEISPIPLIVSPAVITITVNP